MAWCGTCGNEVPLGVVHTCPENTTLFQRIVAENLKSPEYAGAFTAAAESVRQDDLRTEPRIVMDEFTCDGHPYIKGAQVRLDAVAWLVAEPDEKIMNDLRLSAEQVALARAVFRVGQSIKPDKMVFAGMVMDAVLNGEINIVEPKGGVVKFTDDAETSKSLATVEPSTFDERSFLDDIAEDLISRLSAHGYEIVNGTYEIQKIGSTNRDPAELEEIAKSMSAGIKKPRSGRRTW